MAPGVPDLPQGTVTLLFTDIEGSTNLLKRLGSSYSSVLGEHRRILRAATAEYGGHEVDTQGDAFFFAFGRATAALKAAVAGQTALGAHDWPDGGEVRVRMGLHTAEPELGEERYVGIGVHRAARIGAVGHGGQVLMSAATRELADDIDGLQIRDLGYYELKDIDHPERLFQLDVDGLRHDFPPLRAPHSSAPGRRRRRSLIVAVAAIVVVAAVVVPLVVGGNSSPRALAAAGSAAVGEVSPSSGHLVSSVALSATPGATTLGAGSLWVTLPETNSVTRINPSSDVIQQTVQVGADPQAVTFGDGFVWVADSLSGTVTQIGPNDDGGQVVGKTNVGNSPTGLAYGLGAVWVANSADRTVVRINPRTLARSRPIPVDAGADAIVVGDGALWVASEAAGVVSRVDPASGTVVKTVNVGDGPVALAVANGSVWVANQGDGTVSQINETTNDVDHTVTVGEGPSSLTVTGGNLWVANQLSATLSEIDIGSAKVVKQVAVEEEPESLTTAGNSLYVALAGTSTAHRGGTLTLAVVGPEDFYDLPIRQALDPAGGDGMWELQSITNDGLVTYGRSGGIASYQVVPDLAVDLPTVSDGGLIYTFQLRPGIRYSTGALVQPADIRRGIERSLELTGNEPPNSYLTVIGGGASCVRAPQHCDLSQGIVTTPGSNTIVFHLTKPDPAFLNQLALPGADAVPATTPLHVKAPLPATGPYQVAGYTTTKPESVRLVRNPQFHEWSAAAQPAGYPDQIIERWNYSMLGAVHAVEQGRADITTLGFALPTATLSTLQTRYPSRIYEAPLVDTLALYMNTKVAPFNNLLVRRAVNYAVDRRRLIQLVGGSIFAEPSCQVLPPGIAGYRRYCPYTRHPSASGVYNGPDLARAQSLVARSGTEGQRITAWFGATPAGVRIGDYIGSVLRRLHYRVTVKNISRTAIAYRAGRQAYVGGDYAESPFAGDFFSSTFTCGVYRPNNPAVNTNLSGLCSKGLDAQIARADAVQAENPAAGADLWSRLDREITDDAPWVVLHNNLFPELISARAANFTYCWLSAGACLDEVSVR
jgi:YVTN family beta-propeller protein